MPEVSLLAVLVATVVSFVLGGAWYAAFGAQLAAAGGGAAGASMPPWKVGVELLRNFVLAAVLAGVASRADIDGGTGGLLLGLVLWLAFPLVLWTGAIIHEGTPWRLAAIHGGDWLVKLLVLARRSDDTLSTSNLDPSRGHCRRTDRAGVRGIHGRLRQFQAA